MTIIIIPNEPNPNMTGRHYGVAKGLVAAGHTVHTVMWDLPQLQSGFGRVTHLWRSWRQNTRAYEDLTLHKFRRLPYFWPLLNGVLFRSQLRRLYKRTDADIIFAMSYTNETTVPKDLPYVYDLADDYAAPADVFGSTVYKLMFALLGVRRTMRRHCQYALAVTAVSDLLCAYARQYNSRVVRIPNGVEANIIAGIQGQKTKPHSLIYVSGFGPWSRPLAVMQTVVDLRRDFPDISLTLVGEGSEVSAMQGFIAEHKAESYLHYLGFVHDRQKVFQLIAQHEIGLNVSEKNAWRDAAHPMKVVEYSALGKKVVSTNLAGVEALHYPNVFLFSDTNPEQSLGGALRTALLARASPRTYSTVRRAVLAEYSWEHIIAQMVSLFESVLDRQGRQKVVHVTPAYPPNLGGLEKVVQVLATTEAEMGDTVSVITSSKGVKSHPQHDTISVSRLRSFVVANTTILPGLLPRLLRLRKKVVVHLHITQAFTPEMVWLAAKLKRFRYIAHIHLDVPPSGLAGFLLKIYKPLVLRRVLQSARFVVVFTKDQQQEVHARYGIPLDRVQVIPNGVERVFYYDTSRHLHARPHLLFVGRLGYQKNLPLLLRALEGISEDFETTFIGDGELKDELQAQVHALGLKHVTFAGRQSGQALLDYYKWANIFVLPSEREGMPLVLLEAMAMGLPIVATDVTGSRDVVVSGRNGLLVPLDDPVAFREALLRLRNSPQQYEQLHREARRMADDYSWHKIAQQFKKLYGEAP